MSQNKIVHNHHDRLLSTQPVHCSIILCCGRKRPTKGRPSRPSTDDEEEEQKEEVKPPSSEATRLDLDPGGDATLQPGSRIFARWIQTQNNAQLIQVTTTSMILTNQYFVPFFRIQGFLPGNYYSP